MGITGELSKFSRSNQAGIATPSFGIEIDWGAGEPPALPCAYHGWV